MILMWGYILCLWFMVWMYWPCQRLVSFNGSASDSMGVLWLLQNIHTEYYHSKKTNPLITQNNSWLHSLSCVSTGMEMLSYWYNFHHGLLQKLPNSSDTNFITMMIFQYAWYNPCDIKMTVESTWWLAEGLEPIWHQDMSHNLDCIGQFVNEQKTLP